MGWDIAAGRPSRPENPSTNAGWSLKLSDPCGTHPARPSLRSPAPCAALTPGSAATVQVCPSTTVRPEACVLVPASASGRQLRCAEQKPSGAPPARPCSPIDLASFFPEGPYGVLSDPSGHIFRRPGPQGLVGGKAHHATLQGHGADGPARGTFDGIRLAVLEVPRFDIDHASKGTFGRECRGRGVSHRITRRGTPADRPAPSGGLWRPRIWGRAAGRPRPRQGGGHQRRERGTPRVRWGTQQGL